MEFVAVNIAVVTVGVAGNEDTSSNLKDNLIDNCQLLDVENWNIAVGATCNCYTLKAPNC